MSRKSWILGAVIILILAALAYVVVRHDTAVPAQEAAAYSWRFTDWGGDANPQTQVTLVADGKSYVIGTYDGSCAEQDQDFLQYEKSKAVCWNALGGHEIGVFEEPGQVVVRVGELDEGAGGQDGFRGNFTLVKTL